MFSRKPEKNNKKAIHGELNGLLSGFLTCKRLQAAKPYIKGCNRICDIGCGIYRWENIISNDAHYVGLDIEKDVIDYNKKHFGYTFYVRNIEQEDLADLGDGYDLVIMLAVLEHFAQPVIVLEKIKRLLSPNGLIVLTTPHPYGERILNYGARLRIFSNDKHTHHQLLNKRMIMETAKISGFKILKYKQFLFGFNQLILLSQKEIQ